MCSNCSRVGLNVSKVCSNFSDTVCQGVKCGANQPCESSFDVKFYCDYATSSPSCGLCPPGYDSDGQFCLECPEGSTCDRRGKFACKGQCAALKLSDCDGDIGYTRCSTEVCESQPDISRVVTRGSYRTTNMEAECAPYFQCAAGYYKRFSLLGDLRCEPCLGDLPTHARWFSPGLSVNDAFSCLWWCPDWLSELNVNKTGCRLLEFKEFDLPFNRPGYWGVPGYPSYETCGIGRTSKEGGAITSERCFDCPSLSDDAVFATFGSILADGSSQRDIPVQCEWICKPYMGLQIGGVCVKPKTVCLTPGFSLQTGKCVATGYPWNRPGYSKSGLLSLPVDTATLVTKNINQTVILAQASLTGVVLQSTSLSFGISARHRLKISTAMNGLNVERNWTIDGPLCSLTHSWIGGYEFVIGAVCNQSFLAYLNLSDGKGARLGVLIGNANLRGWADGFRTQALFQSELHVTRGERNNTFFVLDRWNCLLREVVIYGTPGEYLTRSYTVYGLTEKLKNPAFKEPKCYGDDSLASPRGFWPLLDQWVAFAVDGGLYQFHMETREVVIVAMGDDSIPTENLASVSAPDAFTLLLTFLDGSKSMVKAFEARCPPGRTSLAGGDCSIFCSLPTRFVNQTSGECVACAVLQCGIGQEFIPCTNTQQGFCRACSNEAPGVFVEPGNCEGISKRPVPPCNAGFYKASLANYCLPCPSLSATIFKGAERVEQCKCVPGLVRKNGICVVGQLYDFEFFSVCSGTCKLPKNARRSSLGQNPACGWECNAGYYHDTLAGWNDKCRPCFFFNSSSLAVPASRGDDDSPWSCEYFQY